MHHRFIVDVDVDPSKIESGDPVAVVRDELLSNLHSVEYVDDAKVESLTEPTRGATASLVQQHREPAMDNDTTEAAEPTAEASPPRGKAHRMPRQGNVHATIFENHGENGTFFTVDFQRRYVDKTEQAHFTHSFKPTDMDDLLKQTAAVQEKFKQLSVEQGRSR